MLLEECDREATQKRCFRSCKNAEDPGCVDKEEEEEEEEGGAKKPPPNERCVPIGAEDWSCAKECDVDDDCVGDEICAKHNSELVDFAFCATEERVNEDDDLEKLVCVDARALAHLPRDALVYEEHRKARVLCDVRGACATAGHMVRFEGRAMMMRSYCAVVGGCVERVMRVNSPRYRRGLVVKSRTEGLVFTAFAARYGTKVEEGVLATAVHVGL